MSLLSIPTIPLADGHDLPLVGLGTYPMKGAGAVSAIAGALEQGYRLIDTATQYGNEREVGQALRDSGVDRAEVTVQTKLAGWDHVGGRTRDGIEASLEALRVDVIGIYLIHWPNPRYDAYVDAWIAMLAAQQYGLIRTVGTSNFKPAHIDRLASAFHD
ncbi:MAG: aldo/keto reductase [Nostocoides sp.]